MKDFPNTLNDAWLSADGHIAEGIVRTETGETIEVLLGESVIRLLDNKNLAMITMNCSGRIIEISRHAPNQTSLTIREIECPSQTNS